MHIFYYLNWANNKKKNYYKTLFADNRDISSYTFNDFIVMQRKNARLCKSDALSCQKLILTNGNFRKAGLVVLLGIHPLYLHLISN